MTGIEAGKAYVKFLLDDSELKKKLKTVGTKLKDVGKIGLTATAPLVAGFAAATKAALDYGDGLGDMAARTGIAVEKLSELQFAADQSDVNISTLERGIQRMTVNIGNAANGTGTFAKTLSTLGVSLSDLQAMSPDQQFIALSDALAKVEDPATRAALAQQVFGKSAMQMMPLIQQGAAGLKSMADRARELGIILSTEDAAALGELDENLKTIKQQMFGLAVQIGTAVAGPLTNFLKWSQDVIGPIIRWAGENPNLIATIAKLTAIIGGASLAAYAFGTALTVIAAHPVLATVIALTAAVVALTDAMAAFTEAQINSDPRNAQILKDAKLARDTLAELEAMEAKRRNPTAPAPQVNTDQIKADAAAIQAQINAGMAAAQATPDIAASAAIDSGTLTRISEGTWKLVEIQQAMLAWLKSQRNGGFTVGAD
jgi:hypothetical protein